jgi:hypothetical protein
MYTARVLKAAVGEGAPPADNIIDLDTNALRRSVETALPGVDMRGLFAFAKARMKRDLTDEDRFAISKIYEAGRRRAFDGGAREDGSEGTTA